MNTQPTDERAGSTASMNQELSEKSHSVSVKQPASLEEQAKHIKEKSIDGSHAKFTWGIQSGRQMERLLSGFADVGEISLIEGMKVFSPIYHVLGRIGFIRNLSNKILVLETR